MTDAIIVVPPLLKNLAGPPAGAAALAEAGHRAGRDVVIVDLNRSWLHAFVKPDQGAARVDLLGDHDRPLSGMSEAAARWRDLMVSLLGQPEPGVAAGEDGVTSLCFGLGRVRDAALALADLPLGEAWGHQLGAQEPGLVGVSVSWNGQVVAALAASILARRRWPGTRVIWGGPQVTSLLPRIAADAAFGEFVDGFVAGYAEATFAELLTGEARAWAEVVRAGRGRQTRAREAFLPLQPTATQGYGVPRLTFPLELGRGCRWGRCAFCSYPVVEGRPRAAPTDCVAQAVEAAVSSNAGVAVRDAYVRPTDLAAVGSLIGGRAHWAACTRLDPLLDRGLFMALARSGLATLELGVESLDPVVLRSFRKGAGLGELHSVLDAASGSGVHLVLNLMAGFPGQTRDAAEEVLRFVEEDLPRQFPATRFTTERNLLQVPWRAPIGLHPERFGIRIRGAWPWSTILGWDAPLWRADTTDRFSGHFDPLECYRRAA